MIVPTPTSSNITNKVKHMQSQNAITLHHQPTPTCIVGATLGSPCLGCSPWHAHPTPSLPPYPHQIPKNLSREILANCPKYRASINLFNSKNLSRETLAISQKCRAPPQNTHRNRARKPRPFMTLLTNDILNRKGIMRRLRPAGRNERPTAQRESGVFSRGESRSEPHQCAPD